jgi:acyl-coenzyme A synthetase/AMP-(fatty) acid ligase
MFAGLTAVVMPRFDLKKFCEHVENYQVTFSNVVPPVVLLLAKHPIVENYDLSSLKMLMSGAAPLTKDLVESVYNRLGVRIKQGYGLTETSPTTHLQSWNAWNLYGSIGQLLPNQVAKFVDLDGNEVPKLHVGELWIKGPNVFSGYVGNPSATRDAFSSDGFFRTGDVGYEDEQGNFFITGRMGEIFKVDGYDVSPAELEGLLLGHPKINDVAVMGIHDREPCTQRPRAYIFPVSGVCPTPETEREIYDWLNERVSSHKRLTGGITWVMGIPKTSSGKILRRVLRDLVEGGEKTRAQV